MRKPWQIASFLFLLMSIGVLIHSFSYPYRDRLGPGPGFFPFWMSIITGFLSLGLFLQTTFSKSPEEKKAFFPKREGAVRIAAIMIALAFVMVFMNPLGFRLSLVVFLFFLPIFLGVRNWVVIPILAVAGSFGVFHVFYYWLKVPLPIGFFGI